MSPPEGRPVFRWQFVALPTDIDELGHVNNAVYVRWLQDIAGAHWLAAATRDEIATWLWVVVRHEIDYRRAAHLGETLTAETWVGEPRGARFDRHVRFLGPDGTVRAEAITTWALIERETRRLARVPRTLAARFMGSEAAPPPR